MSFWAFESLARVAEGRWLVRPGDLHGCVAGVSIDTRTVDEGEAFVAIEGPRFDGHDFLGRAVEAGAGLLVVTREVDGVGELGVPVLLVGDAVEALQGWARVYRDVMGESGTKVVAVTGSNGKTTTRNMIHALLSVHGRGTQSPKSFNNYLGVPLTLLGAREGDGFVVVEVGTNRPGEIEALAKVVRPDVAVITNVGPAHLEGFGSVENVAREKADLLRYAQQVVVVPEVPPTALLLKPCVDEVTESVRRFGFGAKADVRVINVEQMGDGLRIEIDGTGVFELPMLGRHNAMNFAAAYSVAQWVDGVTEDVAGYQAALKRIEPVEGRLEVRRVGNLRVIHDAYNANPGSVAAAIETLVSVEADRRVLVLGDMLELGESAVREHMRVGELIAGIKAGAGGIDRVVLVGGLCRHVAGVLEGAGVEVAWHEGLDDRGVEGVAGGIVEEAHGDVGEVTVLLKASRGMGFERVVQAVWTKERKKG